jgi:hypothetical protein
MRITAIDMIYYLMYFALIIDDGVLFDRALYIVINPKNTELKDAIV